MEASYKPTLRHYAIVGLSIPLIWAGLYSIGKHDYGIDRHIRPTCINPGIEGSLEGLKEKLKFDKEIEEERENF